MKKQIITILLVFSTTQSLYAQANRPQIPHLSEGIEQTNRKAKEMMGHQATVVPPSDPTQLHQFIISQYQESRQQQQLGELRNLLRQVDAINQRAQTAETRESLAFKADLENYRHAFTLLQEMAFGKRPLSITDAFFISEARIEALGIQAIPEEKYQAMLEKHDRQGKLQEARGIDTKLKKSLFVNSQ